MNSLAQGSNPFESVKHIDENGNEYWLARELMVLVEYARWENFKKPIEKAVTSLKTFGIDPNEHILQVQKRFGDDNECMRTLEDYHLTRHGCNITFQNCDPNKPRVAEAQAYYSLLDLIKKSKELEQKPDELDILEGAIKVIREVRSKVNQLEQGQEENKQGLEQLTTRLDNTPIRSDGVKRAKIQGKIKQYAFALGGAPAHYQKVYRKLRPYFGITAFDDIPIRRYEEAINVIQAWIDEENYQKNQQGLYQS